MMDAGRECLATFFYSTCPYYDRNLGAAINRLNDLLMGNDFEKANARMRYAIRNVNEACLAAARRSDCSFEETLARNLAIFHYGHELIFGASTKHRGVFGRLSSLCSYSIDDFEDDVERFKQEAFQDLVYYGFSILRVSTEQNVAKENPELLKAASARISHISSALEEMVVAAFCESRGVIPQSKNDRMMTAPFALRLSDFAVRTA